MYRLGATSTPQRDMLHETQLSHFGERQAAAVAQLEVADRGPHDIAISRESHPSHNDI